ncbi:MAG: right-handed parallel beta-helix repeat-containing protein [Methanosarcinales archaeon]|nr:right-handed parallel beta-helix repeat-containing protein [Methanosarcinales archaeon]
MQADNYSENVDIGTSHLTLQGAGADVVNVTAASTSDHVFNVSANYVNISGFNVTGTWDAGIYLGNVDHCEIFDNTASGNDIGIYLVDSSNNTLTGNNASYNDEGIVLESSNYNTLTGNTASYNGASVKSTL